MTQTPAAFAFARAFARARDAYHAVLDNAALCDCDAVDRDAYNYALRDARYAYYNALLALDDALDAADRAEVVKV